jgi:transposase
VTSARSGRSESTRPWSGRTGTRLERGTIRPRTCLRRSWRRCCRRCRVTQGAGSNDKNSDPAPTAAIHREALGRSRGGLSTKIHLLADTRCRPLVRVTTAGQRHDALAFEPLMSRLAIARTGPGRPRTRPDRLLADKAYSNRKTRVHLRRRGIKATIPEKTDQQKSRLTKGSAGGRPPVFDGEFYQDRNTVERTINKLKDFRAVAMRTDKREFVFQGTIDVASIKIWLRHPANQDRADTP